MWAAGEPGVTVIWNGFQRLVEVADMYRIMHPDTVSRLLLSPSEAEWMF